MKSSKTFDADKIKQSANLAAMLADFNRKEVDESALTVKEMIAAENFIPSECEMRGFVKKQLKLGKLRRVWKKQGRTLVWAYLPANA